VQETLFCQAGAANWWGTSSQFWAQWKSAPIKQQKRFMVLAMNDGEL